MRSNQPPPKPAGSGRTRPLEADIHPVQLALSGRLPIWDIRPRYERMADPGFIPGSRSVPMDPGSARSIPWHALLTAHDFVVLVCLTGRRSEAVVSSVRGDGFRGVIQLTGGVLAWQAEGFPVCVAEPVEPPEYRGVSSLRQLPRVVQSCFVAAAADRRLLGINGGVGDENRLVEQAFSQPGVLNSFERAFDALDLLAENARRLGHAWDGIAADLDGLRATVRRLESAQATCSSNNDVVTGIALRASDYRFTP